MRFLLGLVLALCLCVSSFAQEKIPLKTPDSEVTDAIGYLQMVDEHDRPYIRFFTTYAIPNDLRDKSILTLSFLLHSLTGRPADIDEGNSGSYYPLAVQAETGDLIKYRQVPFSDTLWWIDLRDYNFTEQAWEDVSLVDGYFAEPIVTHPKSGLLRLLAGNAVLRADWFIVQASDLTKQSNANIAVPIYYKLLYAQQKQPANVEDFRQIWGLDLKRSRALGNEHGTIVTKSKAVALHNRALFHYRTELGWLYETYDVKFQSGFRDYIESFPQNRGYPPEVSDAGEIFASNLLQVQVYALRNDKGGLIDFADPNVARHVADIVGDVSVRTPHSCFDCHSAGPIPPENTIREYIARYGKLKLPTKGDQQRIDRVYLSGKFEEAVLENQASFARAIKQINGLKPNENAQNYQDLVKWYSQPVDIPQAAFECGISQEEFVKRLTNNRDVLGNRKVSGRLALFISTGEGIPRDVWENRGTDGIPGAFQQAMITIHGLTKITNEEFEAVKVVYETVYEIQQRCTIYRAKEKKTLEKGQIVGIGRDQLKQDGINWVSVDDGARKWWIDSRLVKEIKQEKK